MKKVYFHDRAGVFLGEIEVQDRRVGCVDPRFGFMVRWTGRQVADYCRSQGWTWKSVTYTAQVAKRMTRSSFEPKDLSVHTDTGGKRRRK